MSEQQGFKITSEDIAELELDPKEDQAMLQHTLHDIEDIVKRIDQLPPRESWQNIKWKDKYGREFQGKIAKNDGVYAESDLIAISSRLKTHSIEYVLTAGFVRSGRSYLMSSLKGGPDDTIMKNYKLEVSHDSGEVTGAGFDMGIDSRREMDTGPLARVALSDLEVAAVNEVETAARHFSSSHLRELNLLIIDAFATLPSVDNQSH